MDNKTVTDYFRNNIFEAYSHYNAWKMIAYSKSSGVVSREMAERYLEIQNYHNSFFSTSQRSFLTSFVILVLHPFDNDPRSFSLYKVDKNKTDAFVLNNKEILDKLFLVRNKVFAHGDIKDKNSEEYFIPPIDKLDIFFKNLIEFYNELTGETEGSFTYFDNADKDLKNDIEILFMNLYRGENIRKKEIDIEWSWLESDKKISDIL